MSALNISSNLHRCHVRGSRPSGHSPTGKFLRTKKMRASLVGTMKRSPTLNSRRMLLYGFLGILCWFARTIESAPLDSSSSGSGDSTRHESSGKLASGLPSKKGQEEEVGNPSELAWQAWLLVDGHPGSQASGLMDSASLLRRITPKSIFIAPALTDCPEGYQDDTMNRCVKDVNIDHQAHMNFLVERLKAIYSNVGKPQASASSSSSSSSSIPTGPLQLNIPLLLTAPSKAPVETEKPEIQEDQKAPPTVEPLKIIAGEESSDSSDRHREAIVTVYELNEDTREDESTFFLGNKSTELVDKDDKSPEKRPGLVLPVGEFVDEPSGKLSGVVDYRIPVAVEKILNGTSTNVGDTEAAPNGIRDGDAVKESEVSPTLVLLLSPTKVPISLPGSDHIVAHNSSLGQVIIKMENVTGNLTGKEIIRVSVPDDLSSSSPAKIRPEDEDEESTTDSRTDGDLVSGEEEENGGEEEEPTTESYADEVYEESTEIEDEILTHSEAGMTVTMAGSVKPVTAETPSVNDDNETTGSSEISSEVSISDDFVRETTLVDFNVSGAWNSTSGTTSSRIEETSTSLPVEPSGFEFVEASTGSSDDLGDDKRDGQTSKTEDEGSTVKDDEKMFQTEIKEKIEEKPEIVYSVSSIEDLFEQEMKSEASSTEKSTSAETMIAASTNDAGQVISREPPKFDLGSTPADRKRGQPFRFSDSTTTKIPSTFPNVEGVYDYEPVPRDYPRRPSNRFPEDLSLPVIRTIDEQRYRPEQDDDEQNFFPTQQQDYVRFPSYDRHGRPNYVRFPSEEANSIHSPNDYKDRNRRPYGQYQAPNYSRGSQTTKTLPGPEIRQKQSYWWVPPGWRTDRQQQQQQITRQRSRSDSVEQRPRDRAPMLLRFWTRMPLVRDPSLNYQQHPTYPTFGGHTRSESRSSSTSSSSHGPSRRVNYYKEMSTQDLSRAFSRQTLPSAIGG